MIFLILLLGFALRLINLNQSLWLDEVISVLAVKTNSYSSLVTSFAPGDFHPPLYYLVLKFWDRMFGYSEIASRFPSVIFSLATGYFIFLLGKKLISSRVGLVAALFWSVNPLAVYYAQEARMYSLAALAVTAAVYFFVTKKWSWFWLSLGVAFYTDYLPWLLTPLFLPQSLLVLIFTLPLLPLLWQQWQISRQAALIIPVWSALLGQFDVKAFLLTPVKFIFGRIPAQALFALPTVFYLWLLSQAKNRLLWSWLLVPLILGAILSLKISVFSYFRFLFVLPAFVLLLAAGTKERRWAQLVIVVISLTALAVFNLNPEYWREDWRSAASFMAERPGPVLLPSLAQSAPLRYYDSRLVVMDKTNFNLTSAQTVYLVRYVQEIFDPTDELRQKLEAAGFTKTAERGFTGVLVWKYANSY